jgi:membrane fusion protein (multidrug efflux system)
VVVVEVGQVVAMTIDDAAQGVGSLRSLRSLQGVVLRPEVSGRISQLGCRRPARAPRPDAGAAR